MLDSKQYGFSLLELTVSISILTVGMLSVSLMMISGFQLEHSSKSSKQALIALRSKAEQIRGQKWEKLVTSIEEDGWTQSFAITGLARKDESVSGEITFLKAEEAKELLNRPDLELSFNQEDPDHVPEPDDLAYRMIFPVRIRAIWRDPTLTDTGERSLEIFTLIMRLKGQESK